MGLDFIILASIIPAVIVIIAIAARHQESASDDGDPAGDGKDPPGN